MEDLKKSHRETRIDNNKVYIEPSCIEAEQGILGAVIFENKIYDLVSDILTIDHFYRPEHAKMWDYISSKIEKSEKVNYVSISQYFNDDEDIKRIGGNEYIVALLQGVISPELNARNYAELIIDASNKRKFLVFSERDIPD